MTPECRCSVAGWCETFKRRTTDASIEQCRTRPDYRELWAKLSAGDQAPPTPVEPPKEKPSVEPCGWRSKERVGTVDCPTCGGSVKLLVYRCDHPKIAGTCTIEKKSGKVDNCCNGCLLKEATRPPRTIVGVTTTARANATLTRTLASLKAGGFDRVWLFSDGGQPKLDRRADLPAIDLVVRTPQAGGWSNFLLALQELNLRFPHADRYAMFQDDVLVPRGLAKWIEANVRSDAAIWSLFCAKHHEKRTPGWIDVKAGYGFCGAQAIVIPARWSLAFLSDAMIVAHKRTPPRLKTPGAKFKKTGEHHIDGAIGLFAARKGQAVKVHYPSLVSHIGDTSTMHPKARLSNSHRKESVFPGESYDLAAPKIACIMLSGGRPERQLMALDAIEDFRRQTYANRILIIVDNHRVALAERFPDAGLEADARIVIVRKEPEVLGQLRNYGLWHARQHGAGLFVSWDDDDRRDPRLLEIQHAKTPLGAASVLAWQTFRQEGRPDQPKRFPASAKVPGWPGSIMAPLYWPLWYPKLPRHEDTKFVEQLQKVTRVIAVDADPSLYVRRIHGANVCPSDHFRKLVG